MEVAYWFYEMIVVFSVFLSLFLAILIFLISALSSHSDDSYDLTMTICSALIGFVLLFKKKTDTECLLPSFFPDFVRKRSVIRFDGADTPKQANLTNTIEEECNLSTESNVSPNLSRKNCRKAKKKKNFAKSKFKMDDTSDGTSKSDVVPKREGTDKPTKVYTPLQSYLDLNFDMYTLYHEFKPYALTRDQLTMYGFPMVDPDYTGAIVLSAKYKRETPERSCCRCGTTFLVHPDGEYESDTVCHYHPSKMPSFRNSMEVAVYSCCNGNYMSTGCITYQYHVTAESFIPDSDFAKVRVKKQLSSVKSCTLYALDCEMIYTTNGFEVAKLGIVSMDGLTVLDCTIQPQNKVLCYNTSYSGVSEKDIQSAGYTLKDVQLCLQKLINKNCILVGHGLENDLRALRLIHDNIVDTSVVFPHERGVRYKRSLKSLAAEFLNKTIQEGSHDCIEDARTCMDLMLVKIQRDLKDRPPILLDENKNSVLQNLQGPGPKTFLNPWEVNSSSYYPYYDDSYLVNNFYPDQSCRRNSMQRQYANERFIPRTNCYAYS